MPGRFCSDEWESVQESQIGWARTMASVRFMTDIPTAKSFHFLSIVKRGRERSLTLKKLCYKGTLLCKHTCHERLFPGHLGNNSCTKWTTLGVWVYGMSLFLARRNACTPMLHTTHRWGIVPMWKSRDTYPSDLAFPRRCASKPHRSRYIRDSISVSLTPQLQSPVTSDSIFYT